LYRLTFQGTAIVESPQGVTAAEHNASSSQFLAAQLNYFHRLVDRIDVLTTGIPGSALRLQDLPHPSDEWRRFQGTTPEVMQGIRVLNITKAKAPPRGRQGTSSQIAPSAPAQMGAEFQEEAC
jgi:hypothetical protein